MWVCVCEIVWECGPTDLLHCAFCVPLGLHSFLHVGQGRSCVHKYELWHLFYGHKEPALDVIPSTSGAKCWFFMRFLVDSLKKCCCLKKMIDGHKSTGDLCMHSCSHQSLRQHHNYIDLAFSLCEHFTNWLITSLTRTTEKLVSPMLIGGMWSHTR